MINYLDLLLYRPTKKDKCEKCEDMENNRITKTDIERKEHAIHLQQGEYMQNRMCNHQATCSGRTLAQKKRKRRKQGGKKTQLGANGANDSENAPQQSTSKYSNEKNAPELSQQSTPKDSNEKNAPEICQPSNSKDSNEKNALELRQQITSKDSNEKNAPEICQPSKSNDSNEKPPPTKCEDLIAHIATDMQQIQNVPKLQVGMAYYKSKVNNHKS